MGIHLPGVFYVFFVCIFVASEFKRFPRHLLYDTPRVSGPREQETNFEARDKNNG